MGSIPWPWPWPWPIRRVPDRARTRKTATATKDGHGSWLFLSAPRKAQAERLVLERHRDAQRSLAGEGALVSSDDPAEHGERHGPQPEVSAVARGAAGLSRKRGALVWIPLLPARVGEPVGPPAEREGRRALGGDRTIQRLGAG